MSGAGPAQRQDAKPDSEPDIAFGSLATGQTHGPPNAHDRNEEAEHANSESNGIAETTAYRTSQIGDDPEKADSAEGEQR